MSAFSFRRQRAEGEPDQPDDAAPAPEPSAPTATDVVEGERTIPSINRARSLQSRVSSFLALGLMSAIGIGLLVGYYSKVATRPARTQGAAQSASKAKAQGDLALPSLGRIDPPALKPESDGNQSALEHVLGPKPESPSPEAEAAWRQADSLLHSPQRNAGIPQKSAADLAFERRMSGAVFLRQSDNSGTSPPSANASPPAMTMPPAVPTLSSGLAPAALSPPAGQSALGTLLQPSVTAAVQARVLPTRELLLAKGSFLDCTLETAIDSTLPGMTTCVTATDTFGTDGRIVLLERGTKLVGETRGQVQQGAARLFVLWSEARTPTGVVVPLASPGTDELGRAGLAGAVNRHFWDRFGAAILISVVNGAVQAAAQSSSGDGGTVVINPTTTSDVMTEVLKSTLAIPPTITKPQGDRIQVLVSRDLDFRSVYELRQVTASAAGASP